MTETSPPLPRKRPWLLIAVGVLVGIVVLCIALIGGGVYWMTRHIQSRTASETAAADVFTEARGRFQGQTPAITLEDGRAVVTREPTDGEPSPLSALHILAYDADDERLVRIEVPGWLLRFMARGDVTVDDLDGVSALRGRLRIADLERRGPGLVLDETMPDGARVLVWTE